MQINRLVVFLVLASFALLAGCSGSSNPVASPSGLSAVSLTMVDAPPSGVISFEVDVTGAVLGPGGPDLLAGKPPVRIEVKRLEVETAFISTAGVTPGAGPFTSLALTFANPELTFQNTTAATIAGCNPGQVCEIQPPTLGIVSSTASVALSPALTVATGTNIGLKVDLILDKVLTTPTASSISVDFATTGGITVAQSQVKAEGEFEDIDDVFGTVQNKNTTATPNTFDVVPSMGPTIKGIQVNSTTRIEDEACSTQPPTFAACLQNGDKVEVGFELMPAGVVVAKKIEKENEAANEDDLEGVVFSVNAANNTFKIVAVENSSSLPASVLGSPVTVSVQVGASFQVDKDGLNVSSTLVNSFTDITALQPGQNVQARLVSASGVIVGNGSDTTPFVVDRVRLKMSRFTATVSQAPAGTTFNVTPKPGTVLAAAGVSTVQVDASQAQFEGVSGTSGLAVNDVVSLRGLLFKQPSVPTLVAGKVRKR